MSNKFFILIILWLNSLYNFKSAIYAIGNSIFHNDLLYAYVEENLPILIKLLNDSLVKTRIHSAGKAIFLLLY
jgi:hypothetical protein